MGARPEQPSDEQSVLPDSVTWISRERAPFEPVTAAKERRFELIFRTRRGRWIVGAVGLALALAAVLWARHASSPGAGTTANAQHVPLVSVTTPHMSAVASTVSFTGTISARYDMPISPEGESGRVTAVLVEAGDRVKRGRVLARLDESVLRPQLNRLAASLEEARAQAALSAAEYRRAQGVEASGALSSEEIARRQAAAVTDAARVRVAAAQLAEAQARLGKTEIRAPADGVVLTRKAEVGQTASPGSEPLFRLARDGEIEMRGQVAERDLATLAVGQPAAVYLTGIAQPFDGRVRLLGAVIDTQTRLGDIRVALTPHSALRPGAFARAEVVVETAQRPVLTQTAVLSDADGAYVYVVNDKNQVERRAVRVANTVPEGIVIGSGLTGNERIVATAGAFLRPGERVDVAPVKAQTR